MKQVPAAIRKVYPAVRAPGIVQSNGQWQTDGRCCVGARMAHALGVDTGNFLDGADAWARDMGGNRAHVIVMLKRAGAGPDPLGPKEWPRSPRDVWARLSEVEELPTLVAADLRWADLRGADLAGADLTGANLKGADLTSADLRGVCLDGANLEDVTYSETTKADGGVLPSQSPAVVGHISG